MTLERIGLLGLLALAAVGAGACADAPGRRSGRPARDRRHERAAAASVASRPQAVPRQRGFVDKAILSGLDQPVAVEFARDGRVFIAEKGGRIKEFDSIAAGSGRVVADLRDEVNAYWDRGLLNIALHPGFPAQPYLYAVYTLDGRIGDSLAAGTVPRYRDECADPLGVGCVAAGRLVRLELGGDLEAVNASERVIIENWGQPFPGHSIAALAFGPDGQLYVGGGEGANFAQVDDGSLAGNPLGDPPNAGGAFRSQVVRPPARTPPYPTWFGGKVLRIDPDDPPSLLDPHRIDALPSILAKGLRNPFRMVFRPGTADLFVGDVGWDSYEEIDQIDDATGAGSKNFGWPCYEGNYEQVAYRAGGYAICTALYESPSEHDEPLFAYAHGDEVVEGDGCGQGSSSIGGLAFYSSGTYPAEYRNTLFFADYSRGCIWSIPTGANGEPDPALREVFLSGAPGPVDLQAGPGGDLYYVALSSGELRRIEHSAGNSAPRAVASATLAAGPVPLPVTFDGSASADLDGDPIRYDWDLNGDGQFGDATVARPSFVYRQAGRFDARLRVTDSHGSKGIATVGIHAGNSPPRPIIDAPGAHLWRVGDTIDFSGRAVDPEEGGLGPAALNWWVVVQHCPSNCHTHVLERVYGAAAGSFVAIDHPYPMHLELMLTATDRDGLTASTTLVLRPQTTELLVDSRPEGLVVSLNATAAPAPVARTVIVGSSNSLSAPVQDQGGVRYRFAGWSDGGSQNRTVVATPGAGPFVAKFEADAPPAVQAAAAEP